MNNDLEKAKNMKFLLCAFEQLSGHKINFHKSELFCYGTAKINQNKYVHIFGCDLGSFPFRYLVIHMHHRKLMNKDWKHVG
jgi:hypothetical protein